MFSKIENISIIYDNGKRSISRFYEPLNFDKIKIINQYFISDLIFKTRGTNINNSDVIHLKTGKIFYSKFNNLIIYIYSEFESNDVDLNLIETTELLSLQLRNKFGKLLIDNYIETFDVSHTDIGNEIDNILGLTSINHDEKQYKTEFGLLTRFQDKKQMPSNIIKQLVNEFNLENYDLLIFQNLFEEINLFIEKSKISETTKQNYHKVEKELNRYIQIERWLKG